MIMAYLSKGRGVAGALAVCCTVEGSTAGILSDLVSHNLKIAGTQKYIIKERTKR
jgi:hypothetical protein